MAEVTFLATVDESRVLRLPADTPTGEVEVVVRERSMARSGEALLRAIRNVPQSGDSTIWQEAREELYRMRDED